MKLGKAKVLLIGVGGLGSPIALYLAAAGVGRIGLVDDDVVSESNLQRQVLYTESEVGQPKVICAARRLQALNSQLVVDTYPCRLTGENAEELISPYDLVIDGCDNFPTRYLISDVSARLHIPYIYGAIREFDGTVIVVSHDREFLDGLVTKVYEFGGGVVKEHIGGIYDFLQKKQMENLNELQLSQSPTSEARKAAPEPVSESKLSYEAQKEQARKARKLEKQVAECEERISKLEQQIQELENKMATPEGASDMQLYEQHRQLKQQVASEEEEWERLSLELEELK